MPHPTSEGSAQRFRASDVLLLSVWFGLVAGLGETCLRLVRMFILDRFLFVPLYSVWTAPLVDAGLFLLVGIILLALRASLPRRIPQPDPVAVFTTLSVFTVLLMYGPLSKLAAGVIALGVGIQAGRMTRRHRAGVTRLATRTLPVAVALVLVAGVGMRVWKAHSRQWNGQRTAAASGAPNVLLIILDTVRALNLSLYGYQRQTSPELERWSEEGTVFTHALATAPWTLPSHASLFTGRLPHELTADWLRPLDRTPRTLAEVFASSGYRTAGFVANTRYTSHETGLARGFDHYEDYVVTPSQALLSSTLGAFLAGNRFEKRRKMASVINREMLGWLDDAGQDKPFFVFLNYIDAHDPYDPPAPYDTLFTPRGADGEHQLEELPKARCRRCPRPAAERPEVVHAAIAKYDESIAYLDAEIGALLTELERRGALENTIVVVTADHGEEFGEHGVYLHGNSLYLASLEVPLIIRQPGRVPAGRTVEAATSLLDLAATITDLAGIKAAPFHGRSLARFWNGADSAVSLDTLIMELSFSPRLPPGLPISRGSMRSVLLGDRRLIRNGDETEELYDFLGDPGEKSNLAGSPGNQEALTQLRRALLTKVPVKPRRAAR